MLERFNVTKWDLVLVGDGSGSNWNNEAGWGVVAIEKDSMQRRTFYGAMNKGTVNFAEMMAYLQPLTWYMAEDARRRKELRSTAPIIRNIHIFTDSSYVRNQGDRKDLGFKKNKALWAAFELIHRQGYFLHWHWAERDDISLNTYADQLSKAARRLVKANDLEAGLLAAGRDPAEANPFE